MVLFMVLGDSRGGLDSPVGEDEEGEEEKLLKQAIALSLEGAEENDNEEEDNTEQDAQKEDEEEEEEELRQAIALSLEENDQEEESPWILNQPETLSQLQPIRSEY